MESLLASARDCAAILKDNGWTVAVSESSSGGLVSAALLAVPGASAYFRGGGVIYTRDARRELLQLADAEVRVRGATEAYALIAAAQIRRQLGATFGLAESGAAGPADSPYGPAAVIHSFFVRLDAPGPRRAILRLRGRERINESQIPQVRPQTPGEIGLGPVQQGLHRGGRAVHGFGDGLVGHALEMGEDQGRSLPFG